MNRKIFRKNHCIRTGHFSDHYSPNNTQQTARALCGLTGHLERISHTRGPGRVVRKTESSLGVPGPGEQPSTSHRQVPPTPDTVTEWGVPASPPPHLPASHTARSCPPPTPSEWGVPASQHLTPPSPAHPRHHHRVGGSQPPPPQGNPLCPAPSGLPRLMTLGEETLGGIPRVHTRQALCPGEAVGRRSSRKNPTWLPYKPQSERRRPLHSSLSRPPSLAGAFSP